jgi:hypothetical protein
MLILRQYKNVVSCVSLEINDMWKIFGVVIATYNHNVTVIYTIKPALVTTSTKQ